MKTYDPATVRKAAALVEALDNTLDSFGARLADMKPIRFYFIGTGTPGDPGDEPCFEAAPIDNADHQAPTEIELGFTQ